MAYNIKKVKGYLVSVLVFYTILVTYFLAQSAWNDDLAVKKRNGRDDGGLLSVLYQEERRHLRSFKDVIKTYGGLVPVGTGGKLKRERGKGDGRLSRKNHGTHLNMADRSSNTSSSERSNGTGITSNASEFVRHTENPTNLHLDMDTNYKNAQDRETYASHPRGLHHKPDTGNIIIEEIVTKTLNINSSSDTNQNIANPYNSGLKSSVFNNSTYDNDNNDKNNRNSNHDNDRSIYNKKLSNVAAMGMFNKNSQNKVGAKMGNRGGSNSISNNNTNNTTLTEYCDKIDAEEPTLCLSEHVTFQHPRHVNITTNHLSFKPFGDIYIYSAFLDTRRKPASIRLMTAGPKGRDAIRRSGYWCAFSLPISMSQRYYWNGRKEPVMSNFKADQATQLEYYAASVGHDRTLQFYIMSCAVPKNHLSTLAQFDSSRIHLVAGGQESPLLDTVQERISVDVVNNQGLPWQQLIDKSFLGKLTGDVNNMKNDNIRSGIPQNSAPDIQRTNMTSNEMEGYRSNSTEHLPTLTKSPHPNSIVSCIAPIFSATSVIQIVEFLELTLLLGSQHVIMYINHVTDDVRDVLARYRYRGLITTLPWTIPDPVSIWARGRDIALNDCLYRSMYRYEFALFHDMDEFFVPRATPDLPSFINFLQSKGGLKPNTVSDLVFSSAYFSPPTKIHSKNLPTIPGFTKDVGKFASLRSIHRTYFTSQHSLRMIRPVRAFRVGAGERKKTVFNISPRYAAVNHYSKCVDGLMINSSDSSGVNKTDASINSGKTAVGVGAKKDSKAVFLCNNTKVDLYLWRLKDRLIRQTKDSIRDLNSRRRG